MRFDEYIANICAKDPYLAALFDAIKDVPIGNDGETDRILEAFPGEDEWYAQQAAKKEHDSE